MDVPEFVRAASHAAFDLNDPDIPVADLVYDSVFDVSGPGVPRRLVFQRRDRHERIRMDVSADSGTVDVRLAPARVAGVTLLQPGRQVAGQTDRRGRARIAPVHAGLLSIVVDRVAGTDSPVRTAWIPV